VSKIQLFLLSLVGAIPAGLLTFLLCMYLIDQPSGASTRVMIFAIVTVLCTATLTVLPVLVLTMYFSNYDPPKIPKAPKKAVEDDAAEADQDDEKAAAKDAGKGKNDKGKGKGKAADQDADDAEDGDSGVIDDEFEEVDEIDSFDEIGTLDDEKK
jgi:hypothetical protein